MHRLALTAASVSAIALGTAAFAQTNSDPSNSSRMPIAPDHQTDCTSGSATAKTPSLGATVDPGSSTDRGAASVGAGGASVSGRTAMADCDPSGAPGKGTTSPKPGAPGAVR
jgi:hypothetical protein